MAALEPGMRADTRKRAGAYYTGRVKGTRENLQPFIDWEIDTPDTLRGA
jgi:hypothetical protein